MLLVERGNEGRKMGINVGWLGTPLYNCAKLLMQRGVSGGGKGGFSVVLHGVIDAHCR